MSAKPPVHLELQAIEPPAAPPAPTMQDKAASRAFKWPMPPFAAYPQATEQSQHEPCTIEALNESTMEGRLVHFVPDEQVAQVQIPPARTTVSLRFPQFRRLTLTQAIQPLLPGSPATADTAAVDPYANILENRPVSQYRIVLRNGTVLTGNTIGHVESPAGLFLFPPTGLQGAVTRSFLPREHVATIEIGPRIGDLLLANSAASADDIEAGAREQQRLRDQKIGDILLTQHAVSPEQLLGALEAQSQMPMVRIGEALTTLGLITSDQLHNALNQQRKDRGVPLGTLLIRMGVITSKDLHLALSRKMGYPIIDVDTFPVEREAVSRVPFSVASRLEALPLLWRSGRLIVAVEDPSKRDVLDELEFIVQAKVAPVLASPGTLAEALPRRYQSLGFDTVTIELVSRSDDGTPSDKQTLVETLEQQHVETVADEGDDDVQTEVSDNSLVRLINTTIIDAIQQGVSDIHIECLPGREKIKVRFRKDGLLRPYLELPHSHRNALVARIKIMCDLDISERRKPQDGKMNFAKFSSQHKVELRVATIPTANGLEDVVMRILASAKPLPLDAIGLSPYNLSELKKAVERPYGMVLCVGPTGSGKTTTLHSALGYINVPERKIWTAEDPVEITQPGLRQVQVNPKIEWTFAKALRAFLRADPDVIMVGEIRDQETAHMAVEASLTGHLVMSTLHTNSAPETITRLLDMGMDPFNFADSLLAVLAQRLVRRICAKCRTSKPASEVQIEEWLADYLHVFKDPAQRPSRETILAEWAQRIGGGKPLMQHHSPGCEHCGGTGYKGRAGLHELLVVTPTVRRLIQTGGRADEIQQAALQEGMRTLRQDGIEKVLSGITSIEEVRATSNA